MKIALLGDIAFFGKFSLKNNSRLYEYFSEIAEKLNNYDLVIGNLETPFLIPNAKPHGYKSAYIGSEIENVELLKYLNVNVVNIANNHIFDYGKESYYNTKKILAENNIKYFGTKESLFLQFDTNNIALNGFCCYSTNPSRMNTDDCDINELDFLSARNILNENHKNGYLSIFSVHCGQEHINYPNADHVKIARKLADEAPFIFYGHHPHVLQGIETVKESLLAYSLGNFCFDDVYTSKSEKPLIKQSLNNKESVILELTIENNKLINYSLLPIFIGDNKLEIGDISILDKMKHYSIPLEKVDSKYTMSRNEQINSYINDRKKKRDFQWYIKRLTKDSIFQILSAKKNLNKYKEKVEKYI